MDIQELKDKQYQLNKDIEALMEKFCEETQVKIKNINTWQYTLPILSSFPKVDVEIEL